MSEYYNRDSIDAVLSRIEQKLASMDSETQRYRAERDVIESALAERVGSLEGDRKKFLGIAIGSGIGAGGVGTFLSKLVGH